MTIVEPRTTRKDWQAILARVETDHPLTRAPEWVRLLDNTDVMAAIIRDLIVIDRQPARRGARPLPVYEEGRRRLQALFGEDFSDHGFTETFQALTRGHSRTQIARRTGISRTRVHRLLVGQRFDAAGGVWVVEPTLEELTAIAAAYNRRPEHFREYRTRLITALVAHHLDEHPERSSFLIQQLAAAGQADS